MRGFTIYGSGAEFGPRRWQRKRRAGVRCADYSEVGREFREWESSSGSWQIGSRHAVVAERVMRWDFAGVRPQRAGRREC